MPLKRKTVKPRQLYRWRVIHTEFTHEIRCVGIEIDAASGGEAIRLALAAWGVGPMYTGYVTVSQIKQ